MLSTARLRLTGWYLLILAIIVGLLSLALYFVLLEIQQTELHAMSTVVHHTVSRVFARDKVVLAYEILAIDAAVLIVAAAGAYILAGRTLRPIQDVMDRQRRFAAAASHELRTPLTALQGNLEVALLNRRTPEEYEQVLRNAVEETQHMGHLVRDLVVLARDESESGSVAMAPLCLAEIARDAVARIEPLARRKQQNLEVALADCLPVRGDGLKLRQALLNLLENAVVYTPESGSIRLVGKRERGRAVVEVRDTGPGIPAQHIEHLFEPFYQVDSARSDGGHVGLGLSLASWIVRAHGGQLDVTSQPGTGTAFTLTLPSS